MSVPDENSTYCEICSGYNLYNAILINGEYYCEGCVKNGKVKLPKWLSQSKQKGAKK